MARTTWILLVCVAGCALPPLSDTGAIGGSDTVRFFAKDGDLLFRLVGVEDGIDVEDGRGERLLALRLRGERLLVEDAHARRLGAVVPPDIDSGIRIVTAGSDVELFELRIEPDGDLQLTRRGHELVYAIKKRDYGYKIVEASGRVESKIRVSEGKISARDVNGVTFLSTRDALAPEAAAAITLEQVPFPYAVALAVAVAQWGASGR